MPDPVFDVLRREPASFAPAAGADELRTRARRRTRSQLLGGGALGAAVLAVAVTLTGGGTTEASQELLPAAPAVTSPAPPAPSAPGGLPEPGPTSPAAAAPPSATAAPSPAPVKRKASARPAAPVPARPAAPSTSPPAPPAPTTPAPVPVAALEAGRHQVRVVAAGWDDTGRHLLLDLGDFVWGEPVEPGVDSTAPLLWESGPVQERLRLDLAEAYDLRFSHAGDTSSWGPGGWDDLVVEVDTRRLVGVVTVDGDGRVTAFEEPYRP